MKRCTFKNGKHHCGSYAFNLLHEGIKQGNYCDRHYWQDQAQKARADECEACAELADDESMSRREIAAAIRARGLLATQSQATQSQAAQGAVT